MLSSTAEFTTAEVNFQAALNMAAFDGQLSLPHDGELWERDATPTRYD
jgi:hypothetical protein